MGLLLACENFFSIDIRQTYVSVVQGSPRGGSQQELGALVWEDFEGQESFPVSAGYEFTTQGLLVQEHNYCATTHTTLGAMRKHMDTRDYNFIYIRPSTCAMHGIPFNQGFFDKSKVSNFENLF